MPSLASSSSSIRTSLPLALRSLGSYFTGVIENLYASDLGYLQRLYEKFNAGDETEVPLPTERLWAAGGDTLRRFTAVGEA